MNLKPTICRVAVLMAAAMMALTVSAQKVKTGIEMLKANNFKQLEGKRVGLVTNPTGVDNFMKSDIDILHEAKNVKLVALFGPEHGVRGSVHAGDHVGNAADPGHRLPLVHLHQHPWQHHESSRRERHQSDGARPSQPLRRSEG